MTGHILEAGHLPLPDFLKDLTPPRQVLMGKPAAAPGLEIRSPVATGVMSRPTLPMEAARRRLDISGARVSSGIRSGSGDRQDNRLRMDF